ncbi:hypothetical protein CI109_105211 [Kwoniella shandongensis]|uniref:Uncharacterized protein n=1 Tax=Kwoniella shandongensis TaxID=1734106 RepID=A0A5M6C3A8_9TREE|nr:uncharacterized protein CI109_002053 [Kwoniella shandongensis]KAA5529628.1 hypothetical protein CI109_002053 [Kwoniella shandongensis]
MSASPRTSTNAPTLTEKPPRRSFFGGKREHQTGTAPAIGDGMNHHTTGAGGHNLASAEAGTTTRQGPAGYGAGFSLGRWIRLHAVDLITMAAMGAIGLGVYEADPAPTRSFPVFNTDGSIAYPEFAYPLRKNIIPIYAAALIAFFVPFVFFVLFQIRHRSLDMLLGSTMGLLESLITGAVFQVFHKWLIGGLRPHFLDVCKPDVSALTPSGNGFRQIMYTRAICTGDENDINDSLESWMSGHSTAAFAGFVYLFFYFNAQLKVMSDHRPAYWKMILTIAPILGASLIAASLTVDEYHNWYDCLGGAVTGTFCAIIAYRKTFAALWDFRFNHIILPRSTSLFHRKAVDGNLPTSRFSYTPQESMVQRPVAKEGGWRNDWGSAGAPGDATAMMV